MAIRLFTWQKKAFLDTTAKFNIIPAGRRTGKTQGGERACIISTAKGEKNLWVDTINGNIERYYERYFLPDLQANDLWYNWNAQKKILKIEDGYIDFRSADAPESIEGFGYNNIYLNEAGIILNNSYLYTNAILPMLMDHDDSKLFAFGTPKGKTDKKGEPHRFYTLWEKVVNGVDNYAGVQLSSYDNPVLTPEIIEELETEIKDLDPDAVDQEIHGLFTEASADKVFTQKELSFFTMSKFNANLTAGKVGYIDPADEGTDFYSFPIGYLIGTKIYVTDWLFTQENTNYTIPATGTLTNQHRLDYLAIETNNHGSVIFKEVENDVTGTTMIPVNSGTQKHARIIQNSGFIKNNFVFREDYDVGSQYDKGMRQLYGYTKNGKEVKNDDSPDSLSGLAAVFRDLYNSVWY